MIDTGNVALWLWDEVLPKQLRSLVGAPLPGGEADAGRLMGWLASLHDLGKASDFQSKSSFHAQLGRRAGLPFSERTRTPHSLISAYALHGLLVSAAWVDADWPALVLAGHHGVFPGSQWIASGRRALAYEHPGWSKIRTQLFMAVTDHFCGDVPGWRQVSMPLPTQVIIAGAVILADWLASNEKIYGYEAPFVVDYPIRSAGKVGKVREVIGLQGVWCADAELAAKEPLVFYPTRWSKIEHPRDVQAKALRVAQRASGPGLMIIEAPMGGGKTEAALGAAEVIAAGSGIQGILIGLPTQATTNQMFRRVTSWLRQQASDTTVVLAHGKADRQEDYRELLLHGIGVDEADGGITASQWLSGGKKRLLAPVVVGTVDQLLMAAVAARHVALRLLGLVGKVVVIDEVHAYDAYMSTILRRALSWLSALGIPVILLSATLPSRVRQGLLAAYAGEQAVQLEPGGYPQISWIACGEDHAATVRAEAEPSEAYLEMVDEPDGDPSPVVSALTALLSDGGCALVIRNTVGRAQRTWRALTDRLGGASVSLVHARYTVADRRTRDEQLIEAFGPNGGNRPRTHVVVATQVAEQSLDVDFDVGVSDLAPVDLLLQRLGRVHRHDARTRPAALRDRRLLIAGQSTTSDGPPRLPRGCALVYGEHLLWRTAAALKGRHHIEMPDDIPELIEQVYGAERIGPESWQGDLRRAAEDNQAKREAMELVARQIILPPPESSSLTEIGNIGEACDEDDPQVQATVRLGARTIEVILLREQPVADQADRQSRSYPHYGLPVSDGDRSPIPLRRAPSLDDINKILDQAIRLPQQLTEPALDQVFTPAAWRRIPWLAKARVLLLPPEGPLRLGSRLVDYDSTVGLEDTRA